MSRVALIVGINHYPCLGCLDRAVSDAQSVADRLERHQMPNKNNFEIVAKFADDAMNSVTSSELKDAAKQIFSGENDIALFYFAGHGSLSETGGRLLTSESQSVDDGILLDEIITLAKNSKAKNRIIILDCCNSGSAGDYGHMTGFTELAHGMTILAASTAYGSAHESMEGGIFTTLLCDALDGAASNLLGDVTPGSVYAHIDQSLGSVEQRPVFKTSVQRFVSLRSVEPPIPRSILLELTTHFPEVDSTIQLDPSYEPERSKGSGSNFPPPNEANNRVFASLQACNRVNLVVPIGAPHMWHAAMGSKSAGLTPLGKHYWRLVKSKRI